MIPSRYQTVYADRPLSAAAHRRPGCTSPLSCPRPIWPNAASGSATVELAVGLDTFRPVMVDRLDDHVMHTEWYRVPEETVAAIETAGRIVAIGTTAVRALESWAATGEPDRT